MVDDKTAELQSEVNRLAEMLNAPPTKVGVVLKDDDRKIYIDDDGRYHYDYWERAVGKRPTMSATSMRRFIGSRKTSPSMLGGRTPPCITHATRTPASCYGPSNMSC